MIVIAFVMPVIVLLTVVASVALGIFAAYVVIFAILHSFGRPVQPETVRPRLVLVPHQSQASGD